MKASMKRLEQASDDIGNLLVRIFHTLALFAIGAAVVWAGVHSFMEMIEKGHFTVEDILLLFIFLELGAMVGIYFKTERMPVRFLIYVAITALTRMMIAMINADHNANVNILYVSGAILILALASLIIRYGSYNMPLDTGIEELSDHTRLPPGPGHQDKGKGQ